MGRSRAGLDLVADLVGVLGAFGISMEIASQYLLRKSRGKMCLHMSFGVRDFMRPVVFTEEKSLITYFSILNGCKDGIFNEGCVSIELHVPQHHDPTQQKSSGIGQVFSCYVGGRAMNLGV